ncbi:CDP-diacylglycerol--serine O-phosphatidyltransferase [Actinokineospora sp. NBRC 105648]|uniref:CDP-diacylglycerol--serine O-phosphatidyltransferase n=1 Tax=Actinokineospora sp. NBRC 105648 TaxID=3032206 RepID=UPI0024A28146|nr:CDP-diacylglycerol--serine O-phosphatidyltransferase [Actinokineospora sp. NBRC 105648]GLZ41542.1 CDP-diacylglycerol--serine O-phosphatidyltransferase [Actinokineospora sp. NBRC 105648]
MAPMAPTVRLLPNALTVLAMCAGLSAVQFMLKGQPQAVIAAIAIAAVLDSLDGRIARMLDATSKMGAELDSLADAISFGVAPALVLYVWKFDGDRVGWVVALIFAVCMILRLARFNTLIDATEQPPYAKEFFVGVPAPAGGLLVLLPLILSNEYGERGYWWQSQTAVVVWTILIAALSISRLPTLSIKTIRVPPRAVALLLVGVALVASALYLYPMVALAVALVIYLLHIPYAIRRKHWLANHPEAWDVPPRERRAIRRAHGSRGRLGLRPPLRRVAGAARRAVGRPLRTEEPPPMSLPPVPRPSGLRGRNWRRTGLRRDQQRPGEGKPR